MDIRAITLFTATDTEPHDVEPFITAARQAFSIPLQTIRLGTPPYPEWLPYGKAGTLKLLEFEQAWQAVGVDYVSIGTARLQHDVKWLSEIPYYINATDMVFASAEIADTQGYLDFDRISSVARIIQQLSMSDATGFGNLFFAATACCGTGYPFFPVACSDGNLSFGIAIEAADLARHAIRTAATLNEARSNLVTAIEAATSSIVETATNLSEQFDIPFGGIDFSMAPFPTDGKSLGGVLEDIGTPFVGAEGSLFAAAFLTDAIQRADFPACGYNGLMLSVLEDSVLARHIAANRLTLHDLLAYSAVCGVGLDTIPLPGDVSTAQLKAILMDTAALSLRLRKPLTARMMPIPGKQAGDPVEFDFPYFANSRVMSIAGQGMTQPRFRYMSLMTLNPIS